MGSGSSGLRYGGKMLCRIFLCARMREESLRHKLSVPGAAVRKKIFLCPIIIYVDKQYYMRYSIPIILYGI